MRCLGGVSYSHVAPGFSPADADLKVGATLGRMVEVAGSSPVQLVYGPLGDKADVMQGTTALQGRVMLPSGAVAEYTGGATLSYYWHNDWQGSVRLATTSSHGLYMDSAYAPYGEQYALSGANWAGFAGTQQNVVFGTYDAEFRHYDPGQARWLSPDPAGAAVADITNPESWNRYAYVLNNPGTLIDPLGLDLDDECCVIAEAPDPPPPPPPDNGGYGPIAGGGFQPVFPPSIPVPRKPGPPPALKARPKKGGCGAQRIGMLAKAAVNFGAAGAKIGIGAASGLAANPVGVAYFGVIGAGGNVAAGGIDLVGAVFGNSGNLPGINGAATAVSTVTTASGLGTLIVTGGNMETASMAAMIESFGTAGFNGGATGNLIDEGANAIQGTLLSTELGANLLDALGLADTSGCQQTTSSPSGGG